MYDMSRLSAHASHVAGAPAAFAAGLCEVGGSPTLLSLLVPLCRLPLQPLLVTAGGRDQQPRHSPRHTLARSTHLYAAHACTWHIPAPFPPAHTCTQHIPARSICMHAAHPRAVLCSTRVRATHSRTQHTLARSTTPRHLLQHMHCTDALLGA